jgi:hypothetical protein
MDVADDIAGAAQASQLQAKYGERVDAESARERLEARLEASAAAAAGEEEEPAPKPRPRKQGKKKAPAPASGGDPITDFLGSSQGKSLQREILRGVFGLLKKRF